jgi:hypothetical protein
LTSTVRVIFGNRFLHESVKLLIGERVRDRFLELVPVGVAHTVVDRLSAIKELTLICLDVTTTHIGVISAVRFLTRKDEEREGRVLADKLTQFVSRME